MSWRQLERITGADASQDRALARRKRGKAGTAAVLLAWAGWEQDKVLLRALGKGQREVELGLHWWEAGEGTSTLLQLLRAVFGLSCGLLPQLWGGGCPFCQGPCSQLVLLALAGSGSSCSAVSRAGSILPALLRTLCCNKPVVPRSCLSVNKRLAHLVLCPALGIPFGLVRLQGMALLS